MFISFMTHCGERLAIKKDQILSIQEVLDDPEISCILYVKSKHEVKFESCPNYELDRIPLKEHFNKVLDKINEEVH